MKLHAYHLLKAESARRHQDNGYEIKHVRSVMPWLGCVFDLTEAKTRVLQPAA